MLSDYVRLSHSDEVRRASKMMNALLEQPFADVLYAMHRLADLPGAVHVLHDDHVVCLLRNIELPFAKHGGSA
jgi:hypothetical protein